MENSGLKDFAESVELFDTQLKAIRLGVQSISDDMDILDEKVAAVMQMIKDNEELKEMIYEELEELGYRKERPRPKNPKPIIRVDQSDLEAASEPVSFEVPQDVSEDELKRQRLEELINAKHEERL